MGIETFKSRARVIDLLGRQEIADAPTATGELFKNALDAGARHVQVDYVDPENSHGLGFLRICDDGLGMRLQASYFAASPQNASCGVSRAS